jgi:hypothetical protein
MDEMVKDHQKAVARSVRETSAVRATVALRLVRPSIETGAEAVAIGCMPLRFSSLESF